MTFPSADYQIARSSSALGKFLAGCQVLLLTAACLGGVQPDTLPKETSSPLPVHPTLPPATSTITATHTSQPLPTQEEIPTWVESAVLGGGTLESVAWSPDGSVLVLGGTMGIRALDSTSLEETFNIPTPLPVFGIAFSPDGRFVAAGSEQGIVQIWDLLIGSPVHTLEGHIGNVRRLAFGPDGTLLAAIGEGQTVRLWDTSTGELIRELQHELDYYSYGHRVVELLFSPDGEMLATVGEVVRLWQTRTGRLLLTEPSAGERATAFSAAGYAAYDAAFIDGGRQIASLEVAQAGGGVVRIYDIGTGDLARSLSLPGSYLSLSSSSDSTVHAIGGFNSAVSILDLDRRRIVQRFTSHIQYPTIISLSPDGTHVVVASSWDGGLEVWDLASQRFLVPSNSYAGQFHAVTLVGPDGLAAITLSQLSFWDLTTSETTWAATRDFIGGVASLPDGSAVITTGNDGIVSFEVPSGRASQTLRGEEARAYARKIAFSPDGHFMISEAYPPPIYDPRVLVWNVNSGTLLRSQREPVAQINDLAFSSTGRRFAAGVDNGSALVWLTQSGGLEADFNRPDPIHSVAFGTNDSVLLAGSSTGMIRAWDILSGGVLREFEGHVGPVLALDGWLSDRYFVSGGRDGTIRIWDYYRGEVVQVIDAHQGEVTDMVVIPGESSFISSSTDGTIRVWSALLPD